MAVSEAGITDEVHPELADHNTLDLVNGICLVDVCARGNDGVALHFGVIALIFDEVLSADVSDGATAEVVDCLVREFVVAEAGDAVDVLVVVVVAVAVTRVVVALEVVGVGRMIGGRAVVVSMMRMVSMLMNMIALVMMMKRSRRRSTSTSRRVATDCRRSWLLIASQVMMMILLRMRRETCSCSSSRRC